MLLLLPCAMLIFIKAWFTHKKILRSEMLSLMRRDCCIYCSRKLPHVLCKASPVFYPWKQLTFMLYFFIFGKSRSLFVSFSLPLSLESAFSHSECSFWDSFIPVAVSAICFFLLSSIPWICQIPHSAIISFSILLHFFFFHFCYIVNLLKGKSWELEYWICDINVSLSSLSNKGPRGPVIKHSYIKYRNTLSPAIVFLHWCYAKVGRTWLWNWEPCSDLAVWLPTGCYLFCSVYTLIWLDWAALQVFHL